MLSWAAFEGGVASTTGLVPQAVGDVSCHGVVAGGSNSIARAGWNSKMTCPYKVFCWEDVFEPPRKFGRC